MKAQKKHHKYIILVYCILLTQIFFFSPLHSQALEDTELYAKSALLMDADSGRVLYSKNGDEIMPMASTTKIMTAILAIESGRLDEIFEVSSYAASMPKVKLGLQADEQYYLKDLLYSLMLESHNDTAVVIAEGLAGSVENFAEWMNEKARELGCEQTNFVTPNGLDADGHHTTAQELALIARYALQDDTFCSIINTRSYSFSSIDGKRNFSVTNKDAFLDLYEGAFGVKTGFTGKAGYCFVGAVKRGEKIFIAVVLACGWPPNKSWKWHDMRLMMDYGMENYEKKMVFEGKENFDTIEVENGKIGKILLRCEGELELLLREDEVVSVHYSYPKRVEAPVAEGDIVGYADVYIDGESYASFPIYAASSDECIDFQWCLEYVLEIFFGS
ncbi:MAG: D-alanyl-D-alanine carboxypeptidase family protein [Lachnospiraceae bacterium]